ncbi:hypothetical protein D3C81_1568470 [compost metagenome]
MRVPFKPAAWQSISRSEKRALVELVTSATKETGAGRSSFSRTFSMDCLWLAVSSFIRRNCSLTLASEDTWAKPVLMASISRTSSMELYNPLISMPVNGRLSPKKPFRKLVFWINSGWSGAVRTGGRKYSPRFCIRVSTEFCKRSVACRLSEEKKRTSSRQATPNAWE